MPANRIFGAAGGNPQAGTAGEPGILWDSTSYQLKVNDGTNTFAIPASITDSAVVSVTAATLAVTPALHAGRRVVLNASGGVAVTLPAASGTGNVYTFIVGTASNATKIDCTTGAAFYQGTILINDTGDSSAATVDAYTANGTTHDLINPTTAGGGGSVGDWVEVTDIATDVWAV